MQFVTIIIQKFRQMEISSITYKELRNWATNIWHRWCHIAYIWICKC